MTQTPAAGDQGKPDCFHCKYDAQGHPCRAADGTFDFAKVAAAILARGRAYDVAERTGAEVVEDETIDWVADCEFETIEDHPHLLLGLMIAAADACATPRDAAFVAAGLYESAIVKHGPRLIDGIETLAAASPKFSYILSAIWSQNGSVDKDVWARIGRAVARHPRMDTDGRGPHDGGPVTLLADAEVPALMRQSVTETARRLQLA